MLDHLQALAITRGGSKPEKDSSTILLVKSVIELGHAARTERSAQPQKATRLLGDFDCKQSLAMSADFGAFGNVPQAIKIHVGTAIDRNQSLARALLASNIFFDSSNSQGTGWLNNRASIFKNILYACTDLIGGDENHFIDQVTR
jgi:hypothetical protein